MARTTLFVPWFALMLALASAIMIQPACGRSDLQLQCVAHRYSVEGDVVTGELVATFQPVSGPLQVFSFVPPSILISTETHEALQDQEHAQHATAETQLRLLLADATREICRRTLEDEVLPANSADGNGFDFRVDQNNCDDYDLVGIDLDNTAVEAGDFDQLGPPLVLNPVCHATCLLEECSYDETGGYDPAPEHSFVRTVSCDCQLELFGDCENSPEGSSVPSMVSGGGLTESYCVPVGELPADYCRTNVADYLSASIRMVNYHSFYPSQVPGTCGGWAPGDFTVVVTCLPTDEVGADIQTNAAGAYTEQDDACEPGCSDLSCDSLLSGVPSPFSS